MKQSTIDGINAALEHAREKHGDQWMGALPLEQRSVPGSAALLWRVTKAEEQANEMLAKEPSRMSVLMSEVGEAIYDAYRDAREPARAELLQVAAMAAQWAEDLEGDGR